MQFHAHTRLAVALRRPAFFTLGSLVLSCALPLAAQTVIPGGTFTTPFVANSSATTYVVNSADTRSNSGSGEVITLGAGSGAFTLTVDGTVAGTGGGRGVRSSNNNVTFNVTVSGTGVIRAVSDDAIQARNGTFNLTNSGTIYSGPNLAATPASPLASGQALDFASAVGGTVINNLSGLIRADGHDAVRLGSNMSLTNYGTIRGNGVVNDSPANNAFNTPAGSTAETFSANEGVSFENGSNSSLNNHGSISGSRHGVETDVSATNITITNQSTGEMIGRNGSGIGSDATSAAAANITIHNYGVVRGDYAGAGNVIDRTGSASATHDGDGDGIDIDGAATINNYATGQILGTGAGGFDTGGRANNSEAVAIGGGLVVNDGLIRGATRGLLVNNDSVASRSGSAATSITNNAGATIEGLAGYAIRLENKLGDARDNDTLVNAGTITGHGTIPDPDAIVTTQSGAADGNSTGTLDGVSYTGTGSARFIRGDGAAIQMGEGADTLTNTGTITGNTGRAVSMEGGNDTVNFSSGTITGSINGGTGADTLNLGAGLAHGGAIQNFETIGVATGSASLGGVISGGALVKTGAGSLELTGDNTYTGGTTVSAGTLRVNNGSGSATGAGSLAIQSGAILAGAGSVTGDVLLDGRLAPGNSIGTLAVTGNVTWNGTLANGWNFELGSANTADLLAVTGDFLKGSGDTFYFDFQNTGAAGTFLLVDWTGGTTFAAGDFSFGNLAAGLTGSFSFNDSQLAFTATAAAIPEPSTYAVICGVGVLGLALWRRRMKSA